MMVAQDMPLPAWSLDELVGRFVDGPVPAGLRIGAIATDSRVVTPDALFIARPGHRYHGMLFIEQAVAAGAAAVLWDADDARSRDMAAALGDRIGAPLLPVPALRSRIGEIASRYYGDPTAELFTVGITGTDGKTSVSQIIAQALDRPDQRCGVVGTLGSGLPGALEPVSHTTPDPVDLQGALARIRDAGAKAVALEVSSHALDQERTSGVRFDVAVLTNLGRDHLDYHGDLNAYRTAKARLFMSTGLHHAVLNVEDDFGRRLLEELPAGVAYLTYGISDIGDGASWIDVRAEQVHSHASGLSLDVSTPAGEGRINSRLLGRFNAHNLLAALGLLLVRGLDLHDAIARLERARPVPGRMERFAGRPGSPQAVVDYAHTPEALAAALRALREHTSGHLWCVFGCGGNRDAGKRPLMGEIAERLADQVVLTNDNPRDEDPALIVSDIQQGMRRPDAVTIELDRRAAITHAIERAEPGDLILVAGKGHEELQWVAGHPLPFSDRGVVQELLEGRRP
jgi:UDP-N-acetylmuramoyl-L-alanyl-D-glutamate--2,6-diaminopimelate ligase